MDDTDDGPYAREPQVEDLVRIYRALNEAGARYLLISGFAVIARGGARTTKDIDLLVDASPGNVARVKQALRILEDHAVDELADTDVARYAVVRVADEARSRPRSTRSRSSPLIVYRRREARRMIDGNALCPTAWPLGVAR